MPTVITQYTCDVCGTGFKAKGSATKCENKHKKEDVDREESRKLNDYVRLNTDGAESFKTNLQHVFDTKFAKAKMTVESVSIKYKGLKEVRKGQWRPLWEPSTFTGFVDYFEVIVKTSSKRTNRGFADYFGNYPGSWQNGMHYWSTYDTGSKFEIFASDFPKLSSRLEALKEAKKNKDLGRQILISNTQAKIAEDEIVIRHGHRVEDALSELRQAQEYFSSCTTDKANYVDSEYRNPLAAALASSIQTMLPEANDIGFDLDIPRFSSTSGLT